MDQLLSVQGSEGGGCSDNKDHRTSVLMGCPVNNRRWILGDWFRYAIASAEKADVDLSFAFVVPEGSDDLDVINEFTDHERHLVLSQEGPSLERRWNAPEYFRMVDLRNQLLNVARSVEPDFLLSVDSDILLHEDAISSLIETYESQDCIAVGGKCYLDFSTVFFPSYAKWTGQTYSRKDFFGVAKVDVLMAIKLMSPVAYNVDYVFHSQGEDFGWSKEAQKCGALVWDGRIANKHVMRERDRGKVDKRCGF